MARDRAEIARDCGAGAGGAPAAAERGEEGEGEGEEEGEEGEEEAEAEGEGEEGLTAGRVAALLASRAELRLETARGAQSLIDLVPSVVLANTPLHQVACVHPRPRMHHLTTCCWLLTAYRLRSLLTLLPQSPNTLARCTPNSRC